MITLRTFIPFFTIRVTEKNGEDDTLVSIKTEEISGKLTTHTEDAIRRCSSKYAFLKILQYWGPRPVNIQIECQGRGPVPGPEATTKAGDCETEIPYKNLLKTQTFKSNFNGHFLHNKGL